MPKRILTLAVGPYAANCYLFWDEASGGGVIIDPGGEAERIISEIDQLGLQPKAILLTHGHGDHIGAVEPIKKQYQLPLYIGEGDEGMLQDPGRNVSSFFNEPIVAPLPEKIVTDDDLVNLGPIKLRVISTPGHTPGGVCYLDEEQGLLFCGDTLFAGSIGRTDLPGGLFEQLMDSIKIQLMSLPDSVICYPGHGPHTTIGVERNSNPFLIGGSYV